MKLIPVKYHEKNYPEGIIPQLDEIAGNLDSKPINTGHSYSLHTEYSYMKRKLGSELLDGLDELKNSHKDGIPQLWKSAEWSEEFAVFIERLVGSNIPPEVIEIHPPFKDYCKDIYTFWERYIIFYRFIINRFPKTKIVIENRCGTMYTGSSFLLSTCNDILELCRFLSCGHDELGVIVDYPQLFSAEKIKMDNVKLDKILQFNVNLKSYASVVLAIHLWGKRKSPKTNRWSPHSGDLNTFFGNDNEKKTVFLNSLKSTYDDEIKRYFVPEVNTSEDDLKSIVTDMTSAGISFVQTEFSNQLLAIDWEEQTPKFILYNHVHDTVWKCGAIGKFSFSTSSQKYCIGNKDIKNQEYLGCSNHTVIMGRLNKCPDCDKVDHFKNCIRCTGDHCYVRDQDVLERCNQEHFVYLAYFSDDIIKVGTAHGKRKYTRLFEQGALYAFIIASCQTGKIARKLESKIRKIGIQDKVSSSYKIKNLSYFETEHAYTKLLEAYSSIREELDGICLDKIEFINPPEIVEQQEVLEVLHKLSPQEGQQLTLWNYKNYEESCGEGTEILDNLDGFQGQIVTFVGTIAILYKDKKYYFYEFKKLIGNEINIVKE